jgi:hypothetical protein
MSDLICGKINPAPNGGVYQGAYLGDGVPVNKTTLDRFGGLAGTPLDLAVMFINFSDGPYFPTAEAQTLADSGGALLLKLEPWNGAKTDRTYSLDKIAAGQFDDKLKLFATAAASFGKPVMVTFGHEMNGDWYPWGNEPAKYVAAFRHIHDLVAPIACNVTWVWNPNVDRPLPDYYPGAAYVDWVAIDGYNNSGKAAAAQIFAGSLNYLKTLNKPMMIGEFGCGADNPACLANFVDFTADPANKISAFVYFNMDKEDKYEISTPAEKLAYRDAIIRHQALFAGAITAAETGAVKPASAAAAPLHPFSALPDPAIGVVQPDGRKELRAVDIAADPQVSLAQMEAILKAIDEQPNDHFLNPDFHWTAPAELYRQYPELAKIMTLDRQNSRQFYWYFQDFGTYWDNAVTLLSAYVQKCLENNRQEKLPDAAKFLLSFRAKIANQQRVEQTLVLSASCVPSDYKLAQLDLTEAEIIAQTPDRGIDFYRRGIDLTLRALTAVLNPPPEQRATSRPDYFTVTKGVMGLGDLYQQLAIMTSNGRYFSVADQLYRSVAALRDDDGHWPIGLNLDLSRLVSDPLLKECAAFSLTPEPQSGHWPILEISVTPNEIKEALRFNRAQGFLQDRDVPLAGSGIFHYLKGTALVKSAILFNARPQVKLPAGIVDELENVDRGSAEIARDAKVCGKDKNKSAFFDNLAKLVKGDLLLALADRLTFYPEDQPLWARLNKIIPGLPAGGDRFSRAQALIAQAKELYVVDDPQRFRYLNAWAEGNQLEIRVRQATYVKSAGQQKKIADAAEEINYAETLSPLMRSLAEGRAAKEYMSIKYDYLTTVLRLAGIADRKDGQLVYVRKSFGRGEYKKIVYPDKVIALIEQLENEISSLSPASRVYFETYLKLKEVTAMIQYSQMENKSAGQKAEISRRIESQTGRKDLSPASYALKLLKEVEERTASAVPPYLWANLTVTLPALLADAHPDQKKLAAITDALTVYAAAHLQGSERAAYPSIKDKLDKLSGQIKQGDFAAAQGTQQTLVHELQQITNRTNQEFAQRYSDLLAWDMHALHAELYDGFAVVYGILGNDRPGTPEGHLFYQYSQSAYIESFRSSSKYDREERSAFIYQETENKPDVRDPALRQALPELWSAYEVIFGSPQR